MEFSGQSLAYTYKGENGNYKGELFILQRDESMKKYLPYLRDIKCLKVSEVTTVESILASYRNGVRIFSLTDKTLTDNQTKALCHAGVVCVLGQGKTVNNQFATRSVDFLKTAVCDFVFDKESGGFMSSEEAKQAKMAIQVKEVKVDETSKDTRDGDDDEYTKSYATLLNLNEDHGPSTSQVVEQTIAEPVYSEIDEEPKIVQLPKRQPESNVAGLNVIKRGMITTALETMPILYLEVVNVMFDMHVEVMAKCLEATGKPVYLRREGIEWESDFSFAGSFRYLSSLDGHSALCSSMTIEKVWQDSDDNARQYLLNAFIGRARMLIHGRGYMISLFDDNIVLTKRP
jgi:hypothetical protein